MSEAPERLWTMGHGRYAYDEPHEREGVQATEYIRADRTTLSSAAVAEREPVAWRWKPKGSEAWIYDPKHEWLEAQSRDEIDTEPLYLDPPTTSELEAENARLRADLDSYKRAATSNEIEFEKLESRLAEAMKAFAAIIDRSNNDPLGTSKVNDMRRIAEVAARRVREGGKVDG